MTDISGETHEKPDDDVVLMTDDLDDPPDLPDEGFDDDPTLFDEWPEHDDVPDLESVAPPGEAARAPSRVTYKNKTFTPTFRDALQEMDRLLPDVPVRITQGGFNGTNVAASAGTHAGDAVDISVNGLSEAQVAAIISTARKVGIAAWFRTTSKPKWGTRSHGFKNYHIHGVPNGWGSPSSGAASQARSYRAGKDGLKGQGADRGPGHVSTYRLRTWAAYLASKAPVSVVTQADSPNLPARIPEDGIFGPVTIKRVQRQVRVPQVGIFGPVTKSAFRTWLRFDPGTAIDTRVIKAMQGRVGVGRDGDWGPVTTEALQRFLNRNRTH